MKNVVTIGGGTGSFVVLYELKNFPDISISAIVSMADDGGSSGILRKKWHVSPPGDVRQCLAALSGKTFLNKKLGRHKIGNVILALLEKMTGDFNRGLRIAAVLFGAKGKILPITDHEAELKTTLKNDRQIIGEHSIDTANLQSEGLEDLVDTVSYVDSVELAPGAREAIIRADFIIIGPGNIFCSILPNFITSGFREALAESSAKIIFVMNLVNKPGHTLGWSAQNYIAIIEKYLGKDIDVVLMNSKEFSKEQRAHYLEEGGEKIFIGSSVKDSRIIRADLLADKLFIKDHTDPVRRSLIRHDSEKLAQALQKIFT